LAAVLTRLLQLFQALFQTGVEDQVAKSFIPIERLPSHVFVLSEAEKQKCFEGLRMMNVRNEFFWKGFASRNEQLEDMGFNPWARPLDKSQIQGQILREQASKGGQASKADWLTLAIRRIVDESPEVSENNLRKKLSRLPDVEFWDDSDIVTRPTHATWICYVVRGHTKKVRCSGLKDRLSRTKKESR